MFVTLSAWAVALTAQIPEWLVDVDVPPAYGECIERETEAANRKALRSAWNEFDVEKATEQVTKACEPIWSKFQERMQKRYPNREADLSLAVSKSVFEDGVEEKLEETIDAMQAKEADARQADVDRLGPPYVDCLVEAATEAASSGAAKAQARAEAECQSAKKAYVEAIDEFEDVSEIYGDQRIKSYLQKAHEQARKRSAPAFVEARKQACLGRGNSAAICDWQEKLIRAKAEYEKCVIDGARRAAFAEIALGEVFALVQDYCDDDWAKLAEASREVGDSSEAREDYLKTIRAHFRKEYPPLLERMRDDGRS